MKMYEKITNLLKEKGVAKKKMCLDINISYNSLMSMFSRKSKSISLGVVQDIADYLGVTIDYLIRDEITDPSYGIKPKDVIGANADIDVADMINAGTGLNEQDIRFIQSYIAMPEDVRSSFRDSLFSLAETTNKLRG